MSVWRLLKRERFVGNTGKPVQSCGIADGGKLHGWLQ